MLPIAIAVRITKFGILLFIVNQLPHKSYFTTAKWYATMRYLSESFQYADKLAEQ